MVVFFQTRGLLGGMLTKLFSLAFVELRLILARIVFNFDMELSPECRGWADDQELFAFWNKPALNVFFKPRKVE